MTNPKANKPLSLEQIRADAKSMGIPATALMDMLAGTLRGATASTLGTPADIYNLANTISGDRLGNIPYDTDYFRSNNSFLPPTIPGNDRSREHTAEFGEDFGTLAGVDDIRMAKLVGKGVAKGAKLAGQEIADRVATGRPLIPGIGEPQMAMFATEPSKLHSHVDKVASELPRAKGTGAEFMTELSKKPGVKKAELADRNLHEIHELPKMTKEQFLSELADRPVPQVTKKVLDEYSAKHRVEPFDSRSSLDRRHWVLNEDGEPITDYPYDTREDATRALSEVNSGVFHKNYKLPGGSNYQEHLYKYEPEGEDPFVANSNHFGGEPNVLASARTVDRKTPDGKKILHVEEIQSDWHQKGRDQGYGKKFVDMPQMSADELYDKHFDELTPSQKEYLEIFMNKWDSASFLGKDEELDSLTHQYQNWTNKQTIGSDIPDAPFKKNWEEMVSKDLIKHAIDNGYDGIALTNGKDQANRYDLSKHIGNLSVKRNLNDFEISAKDPNGKHLFTKSKNSLIDLDQDVGKELAEKIKDDLANKSGHEHNYSGLDLELGGEGMKGFYDKKMPNIFNDIGKQYSAEMKINDLPVLNNGKHYANRTIEGDSFNVMDGNDNIISNHPTQQEANIKARELNSTPLHYMEFTPEMKQGVATEGLPAYADGGQVAQPRHEAFLNPSIRLANGQVTLDPLEFMPNYLRGGKVHVSDDIDMMRHEIHMSGGGSLPKAVLKGVNQFLTKAEKVPALPLNIPRATPKTNQEIDKVATRVSKQMLGEHVKPENSTKTVNLANRSMRENERVKSLPYQIQPTGASQKAEAYEPKIGDVNIAIPGDQTISDSILRHVGDLEDINSVQEGGGRYGLGKMGLEHPLFWASGEDPAQMAQDKITRLAGYYSPDRVIGQHMAMGPISNNFAMHLADANLKSTAMHIADGKINPEQMYSFDNIIANGYVKKNAKTGEYEHINFPNWPGVADLEGSYKAMQNDPELRKWYNNRMKTPDVTSAHGLPNGLDIQWAITEPALRNMEVNLTGLSAGKMVPGAELTDTASHNTYAKGIQGLALQPKTPPGAFEILYPDATQYIRETKNPSDFTGTIQKVFPHQLVDDQYLNEVGQYNDFIKKYTGQKKGGTVHMGAGGSLVNKVAEKLGQLALPIAEREANKAKFLEPSKVKERMYHGTGADIKQFMPGSKTNATFLSHDPYLASSFAENRSATNNGLPNVMPVHAQIKNPWDYENPDHVKSVVDELNKKKDYFGAPSGMDYEPKLNMGKWATVESPEIQKIIKELGHDSFYVKEGNKKNIGVYEPNQIKSAIGNQGTYDINNPDITKAKGGKVHITDNLEMMRHELNRG